MNMKIIACVFFCITMIRGNNDSQIDDGSYNSVEITNGSLQTANHVDESLYTIDFNSSIVARADANRVVFQFDETVSELLNVSFMNSGFLRYLFFPRAFTRKVVIILNGN